MRWRQGLVASSLALVLALLLLLSRDTSHRVVRLSAPAALPSAQNIPVENGLPSTVEHGLVSQKLETQLVAPTAPQLLSPWDAELNAHYRTLLQLPPLSLGSRSHDPLPRVNASGCASLCSGHGNCHHTRSGSRGQWTLRCACHPGWSGERCDLRDASPCNTPEGGRVLTRCAGRCDEDVNRCTCGPGSRFPNRPMVHCYWEGVERSMPWVTPAWAGFARAPKSAFWTPGGPLQASTRQHAPVAWCDADPALRQRPSVRCKCYDGQNKNADAMCAPVAVRSVDATFCPNQCMLRGECISGFCRCATGFAGADCSIEQATASRATAAATYSSAASDANAATTALRPRVYVYELPGEFNVFLLARRQSNDACAIREYSAGGGVSWTNTLYGAEVALHEALLASPHRTLDPELADYFYVPVFGGCFISEFNRPSPKHWLCDECHKGRAADLASLRAMRWHDALLGHIRQVYPYWNRSGGSDHLWPFTHDEGACYAPASVRNATLLVHWGRMHARPNGSSEYHLWRVRPHARTMYGWERCYDPCKDLVLPSWRRPEAILSSPYVQDEEARGVGGEDAEARRRSKHLFYFNGVIGATHQLENYSFGLRQQLFALYGGREGEGIVVTDQKTPTYSAELSASTFCGVLPGWGWSGRMEDAVLHGCIPVILQDGVHTPWESVLDTSTFALRIPRDRMHMLLQTLRAVPAARIRRMRAALRRAWPRFSYLSVAAAEYQRRDRPMPAAVKAAASRDAVATLLQVLRARAQLRAARSRAATSASSQPAAAEACEAEAHGGDISPPKSSGTEARFEGRLVNGWVI